MTQVQPVLILLRHGQAEPYRVDDAGRALVPAGIAEVERSCAFLQAHGWIPEELLASPYRRAQETAAIVRRKLGGPALITTESQLLPDCDVKATASLLDARCERPFLVATHMPLVSGLVRALTGAQLNFVTGALAVLVRDGQGWRLAAQYSPEI